MPFDILWVYAVDNNGHMLWGTYVVEKSSFTDVSSKMFGKFYENFGENSLNFQKKSEISYIHHLPLPLSLSLPPTLLVPPNALTPNSFIILEY